MARYHMLRAAIILLTAVAVACGGSAAPTATAPVAPTATGAAAATPTRVVAAAASTPTPTSATAPTVSVARGSRGTMTMASVADITNLDVHVANAAGLTWFYIVSDVNAALLAPSDGPAYKPYLAESWQWVDPGRKIKFTIRKGARFHDGKAVTAQDVACTMDKLKDPNFKGTGTLARLIKEYEVVDDRSIVFTTTDVLSTIWFDLAGFITQPCHQPPYSVMQKNPIGAGPYKVVEWRPFESLLIQDAGYFWQPVEVNTIRRLVVPEPESRLAMLKAGQIDFMDEVQPRQAEQLLKDKRYTIEVADGGNWASLVFSTDTDVIPGTDVPNPFLDVRVRRAFIMALDRKAIFDGIALGKYGTYIPGPWPRYMSGGSVQDKITPYAYDPKGARQLLEEAKFPFDLEWPFWVYRTTGGFSESAEAAVSYWNAIGVKARYRLTEVGTLVSYWSATPARTYPLKFIRASQFPAPEPGLYVWCPKELAGCGAPVRDPKLLQLGTQLRTAFEPAERDAILQEAYRTVHDNAVQIPIMGGALIYAFNQRVYYPQIEGDQRLWHLWRTKWLPGAP